MLIHTFHAVLMPFRCRDLATILPFSDSAKLGQVAHMPSVDCRFRFTNTMPFPSRDPAVTLRGRFQNGMFVAWQGNGLAYVTQTRPHCVNQMGKTQSKPLAERHGRGTSWQRNGMAGERHGRGTAWQGNGMAGERHSMGTAWHVLLKHGCTV
jgi:hypothetical protein